METLVIIHKAQRYLSLNRTMQYGNVKNPKIIGTTVSVFKSYYVVWKRKNGIHHRRRDTEFKSYYVVWKPQFLDILCSNTVGLNRTMQYGNSCPSPGSDHPVRRFKSYYVVWKPGAIKNTINGQPRLNRTMQYGNC